MEFENIPREAVADWKTHEVTKAVISRLKQNYNDYQELLNGGGTLDMTSSDQTAMRTSAIVSRLDELRSILNGLGENL
jgi:hypothetical protein